MRNMLLFDIEWDAPEAVKRCYHQRIFVLGLPENMDWEDKECQALFKNRFGFGIKKANRHFHYIAEGDTVPMKKPKCFSPLDKFGRLEGVTLVQYGAL